MVYSLTNSSQRIDQAVSAVHSGFFPGQSGVIYSTGNQTVTGHKTFAGNAVFRAGLDASGNVSGKLSPYNDGLVDLGATTNRFGTLYATGVSGTNAYFGGNVTIVGSLTANLSLTATGLTNITVTETGAIQNLRVTGTSVLNGGVTISGAISSLGANIFAGQNTFSAGANFQGATFFENGFTTTGTTTFVNGFTSKAGAVITGSAFSQSGAANMSGTLSHSGNIFQNGAISSTGELWVNGNTTVTGNFTAANGTTTLRSSTLFTTGASAGDRLRIIQNVDQTGDYNLTGTLRVSSNANISGDLTVDSVLSVSSTGYFEGVRSSGLFFSSGTNTLTGTNSLQGNNFFSGRNNFSGTTTFTGSSTEAIRFDSYHQPFIVARGFGTTNLAQASFGIANFWAATTANAVAPGTGNWITSYTGKIGEVGLFLTGANDTVAKNNNLPLGTYGRVFQLVNVGTAGGSGVWYPIGV